MKIHREGTATLISSLIIFTVVDILVLYVLPKSPIVSIIVISISAILFLLILQFFRYPARSISRNDNYVIAPADGKVVAIEEVYENEYFNEKRKLISIFMSPLNVHANWYPMSGQISTVRDSARLRPMGPIRCNSPWKHLILGSVTR